jgi:uncharacterized membrane protein YqjE
VTNGYTPNGKSMADVLSVFKEELKDFANTRYQMLRNELSEKASALKAAIPAIVVGAFLLLVAFLLFTGGLVALIAIAFAGHVWAYAAALFIVFLLYAIAGGAAAYYGYRSITSAGMAPERTMRVLKQDGVWLQTEARTQV